MSSSTLNEMFNKKYEEFASDLVETFPELTADVSVALKLTSADRISAYKESVFSSTKGLSSIDAKTNPGTVLPGVTVTDALWESIGNKSRVAIYEYIAVLNLNVAFLGEEDTDGFTKEWAEKMMRDARASMDKIDFEKLSEKFFSSFGTGGKNLPPLPEKFLKGKLAKLAEDMVKEFKPEDFGLKPEELEACERDPTRAFEILMSASMGNPQVIQSAMTRIGKKLQQKVASGELRPQELVAEAEEMIKEFQSHPAFVDLMETFRSAFNVNEKDMSRMPGHTGDGRLAEVRERLRKKAEAKKATTPAPAPAPAAPTPKNTVDESEDFPSIAVPRRKKK
jgi:hypothetical protein